MFWMIHHHIFILYFLLWKLIFYLTYRAIILFNFFLYQRTMRAISLNWHWWQIDPFIPIIHPSFVEDQSTIQIFWSNIRIITICRSFCNSTSSIILWGFCNSIILWRFCNSIILWSFCNRIRAVRLSCFSYLSLLPSSSSLLSSNGPRHRWAVSTD